MSFSTAHEPHDGASCKAFTLGTSHDLAKDTPTLNY